MAVDAEEHIAHLGELAVAFSVAVPVVIFLAVITGLRVLVWERGTAVPISTAAICVLVLVAAGLTEVVGLGVAILLMGLATTVGLAVYLARLAPRGSVQATTS